MSLYYHFHDQGIPSPAGLLLQGGPPLLYGPSLPGVHHHEGCLQWILTSFASVIHVHHLQVGNDQKNHQLYSQEDHCEDKRSTFFIISYLCLIQQRSPCLLLKQRGLFTKGCARVTVILVGIVLRYSYTTESITACSGTGCLRNYGVMFNIFNGIIHPDNTCMHFVRS